LPVLIAENCSTGESGSVRSGNSESVGLNVLNVVSTRPTPPIAST